MTERDPGMWGGPLPSHVPETTSVNPDGYMHGVQALCYTGCCTKYFIYIVLCILSPHSRTCKIIYTSGVCVCLHTYIYNISIKQMNNDDNGGDG